ncbi:MAG: DUF4347 domain-containing protein, partial [Proteobacteria bacterium]|nr:DUF4347 domain-containing protein [Pseudomonadota bacterium]
MPHRTHALRCRPLLEDFEPRILYAADHPAVLAGALAVGAGPGDAAHSATLPAQAPAGQGLELVFIDSRVDDHATLTADLQRQMDQGRRLEVVWLGEHDDAISVISQTLARHEGVSAIHLFSHGAAGEVLIGAQALDMDQLLTRAGEVAAWGDHLAPGADLLIYGCDVATGSAGEQLIQSLAQLTGVDVAASVDRTGDAAQGGNWALERQTGGIEARQLLDDSGQAQWRGVLAITTNDFASSAVTPLGNNNSLSWSHTVAAGTDRALFVEVAIEGVVASVTSVYFGSQSLTFVGRQAGSSSGAVEIWVLLNPTVGTSTITVSTSPTYTSAMAAGGTAFNGVNQTKPVTTFVGASGQSNKAQVTMASNSGDLILATQHWRDAPTITNGGGQSDVWERANPSPSTLLGHTTTAAGAASVTMVGNASASKDWVIGAISIKAAGANTPPVGSDKTVTGFENQAYTFTAADFPFTDANGDGLKAVQITALPAVGSLTLNGVAVTANQFITKAAIDAGKLKFTSTAHANGAGYASFKFKVQDDAGVGTGGGSDIDGTARTLTINVTAVNSAPQGANNTVAMPQNQSYTFGVADFGFSDPNDSPANSLQAVKITTTPGAGSLTRNGVAVTNGQLVSASDIAAGLLKFTPVANGAGAPYASFTFQVQDNGGTANGGIDLDQTPKTLTLNVVVSKLVVDTTSDSADGNTSSIYTLLAGKGADGKISLREAITAINNTAGSAPVTIEFNIAGTGIHTITLASMLPDIVKPVIIDATTDDSFAANGGRPAIVLNGGGTVQDGLRLYVGSGGSTIRGLVIQNFTQDGIDIASSHGNTIAGNWIGLNSAGTGAAANQQGVNIWASNNNVIGGTTAADRNVISGNSGPGLWIDGGATGNQVRGNYIGTNVAGAAAVANQTNGIRLLSTGNTIGGTAAGAGNVISGNLGNGIDIAGTSATGNTVAGNTIGLNATGTAAVGNSAIGIRISGGASSNTIGGATGAARNVISGNGSYGISVEDANTSSVVIQNNWIGVNASGTSAIGNTSSGIALTGGPSNFTIASNWIALSGWHGIYLNGASADGVIRDNRIGTDAAGSADWGSNGAGIQIGDTGHTTAPTRISVTGNIVAYSKGAGVRLLPSAGTSNPILGNSIYGSTSLGIGLGSPGVTPNDPGDADTGPNNLQNFPVLQSVLTNGSNQVNITGTLNSNANGYYRIEYFASPSANASGYGEGKVLLGFLNVATDASGNATISTTFATSLAAGWVVSATATKTNSSYNTFTDTSEFSQAVVATEVNKAPSGANKTVTTLEDQPYTFTTSDFGFSDPGDSPANNLLAVKVTTLPSAGSLTLNGTAVTAGQLVSVTDINAGKLKFTPAADANGTGYASFTFQVQDDGGTAMGGVDLD